MSEQLTPSSIGGLEITTPEEASHFNIMVYGDSGVGKTLLAGTALDVPELCPILFISVESGTLTLRENYPDAKVVEPPNWKRMQKLYDDLYSNNPGFKTIVIDSLSDIQNMAMNSVLSAPDPSRNTGPKLSKEFSLDATDSPDMKDQQRNTDQMRRFVRAFRDLPVNTIFTALENTEVNQNGIVTSRSPKFTKTFSKEVPAFFDFVFYLYLKSEKSGGVTSHRHVLLTQKTEKEVAKSRISSIPQTIQEPTMPKIYEYLASNTQKESDS